MQYIEEFNERIEACNNSLLLVKNNVEGFQKWRLKKTIILISISAILAILSSLSITGFVIYKYPPKVETMVLKANDLNANGPVNVFDVAGKICGKK